MTHPLTVTRFGMLLCPSHDHLNTDAPGERVEITVEARQRLELLLSRPLRCCACIGGLDGDDRGDAINDQLEAAIEALRLDRFHGLDLTHLAEDYIDE